MAESKTDKNYLGYYDIVENWFTAENLKNYLATLPLLDRLFGQQADCTAE